MTDREFLQNLKSMLDAQLQNNVIPVVQPPNPIGINPVTAAWLGAGGPKPVPQDLPPAEAQPEFRDGNFHVFHASDSWSLTADRDCAVWFTGGEAGGNVPGPVRISIAVNGEERFSGGGQSTFFSAPAVINPDDGFPSIGVKHGDNVTLTISGGSGMVVMARLGIR